MEDVTNAAFRRIAKQVAGPGLMFTEFVSAMAVHHGSGRTLKKMRVLDDERPLGIQIFGGDPGVMAETARVCEEMGADLVDINMGCWVPKVCKTGAGAALLKDPDLAEEIVKAVVSAVRVPVSVKVRAGWTYELFAAPDLAKRFEDAGAQMLTLHARFAKQGFSGEANWKLIEALRKAVTVPLIGNGDVKEPEDALRMFKETGCDGVMVGRAAISNPWRLRRIVEGVKGEPLSPPPTLDERVEIALEHLRLMIEAESDGDAATPSPTVAHNDKRESTTSGRRSPVVSRQSDPELRAVRALRGQIPLYIKGEPGAAALRGRLVRANSYSETEEILRDYEHQERRREPTMAATG